MGTYEYVVAQIDGDYAQLQRGRRAVRRIETGSESTSSRRYYGRKSFEI